MKINGVSIGDKFKIGKHGQAEVVDLLEKKSLITGEVIGYICLAKGLGLAVNTFETPFATVVRRRLA